MSSAKTRTPPRDLRVAGRLSDDVGADFLEYAGVVPLAVGEGRVRVGTWRDEVDEAVLDALRLIFSREPELVPLDEETGLELVRRHYGDHATTAREVIEGIGDSGEPPGIDGGSPSELPIDDLRSLASEAPVVKLVNLLLLEALEARASDIHLEAYSHGLEVRYRVDGILQDAPSPPRHLAPAVASRIKIMADLDIAERRVPQDGRIRLTLQDREVDVRVSTLPALHGESIVLRLLDKEASRIGIDDLGMSESTLGAFLDVLRRPHGIVLATGPTGSGKTTTLYAGLDHLRTGREKIITVEDPVEYELPGVPQVTVNEKVGLTFASALRSLLRQDPDVMLVGEIRDEETADIATHAALTGHLVLSTLHTNDAPSALARLLDLGIPAYLVGSTVEAILAQRLVRKVCPECAGWTTPTPATLQALGATRESLPRIRSVAGCEGCRGTGYRGRTGVYELLAMDDAIRSGLRSDPSASSLRRLAVASGMSSLLDDGLRLVRTGTSTPDEVLRVTSG